MENVSSILPPAEAMMSLFSGNENSHGMHGEPEQDGKKWGIKKTARTIKKPVTVDLWQRHLDWNYSLGIIPIKMDGTACWGSIDIDDYNLDFKEIIEMVDEYALPLVPCKSKSGGLHLFLFTAEPVAASILKEVLKSMSVILGFGSSEIFPKQTSLEADGSGNWIAMPYGNNYGKMQHQHGIKRDGKEMDIKEFIFAAMQARVKTGVELEQYMKRGTIVNEAIKKGKKKAEQPETPFIDGPCCLQTLTENGKTIERGGQNNALLMMGIYYKKRNCDNWEQDLKAANYKHLNPHGNEQALNSVIKSLKKKDYNYTCQNQPMCAVCNASLCRTRKYGVGDFEYRFPRIISITKWVDDPPTYTVEMEQGVVSDIYEQDLYHYRHFSRICFGQLDVMFKTMKQDDWADVLAACTIKAQTAVDDSRQIDILKEQLEKFIANCGERREDIVISGLPWYDVEKGMIYFRLQDLHKLTLEEAMSKSFTRNWISRVLRKEFEGSGVMVRTPAPTRLWQVPAKLFNVTFATVKSQQGPISPI